MTDPLPRFAATRLLTQRNFALYFAGNTLSATGTWFQTLAAALLVYRLTGSVLLLGVLSFAQFAASLVLFPWAGSAADRLDRHRLLLVSQCVGLLLAGSLAVITAFDAASAGIVIAFSLGVGVVGALSVPAQLALITQLVERAQIPAAMALDGLTFNLARAVGPALAAISVSQLGIAASFAINAGSYLVFVTLLLLLRPREQTRAHREQARLTRSLQLLKGDPHRTILLVTVAATAVASDPINTLGPAWAHAFDRPDTFAGYIIGAFGAGAVVAAVAFSGRIGGSDARLASTLVLLTASMILFSLTPWFGLSLVILFAAGVGYLTSNAHATAGLQLGAAEHELGRVMALWSVAFLGIRPIAGIVDGAIASAAGVRVAGIVLAIPAAAAAFMVLRQRTREVDSGQVGEIPKDFVE